MTQTATSPQRKPLLDEASFQQLLSAAYVLQEHNDRLRAKGHQADFAENLSAIVETQKLIQTLQLDLAAAAELVAERVQKITHASGTAIGIIEKDQLFYRSATGTAALDAGTRVPLNSALSADCLSKGSAINYPDVTPNLHVHADLFRSRDVKAFIAVPVYHAGQVAGVLELRFARVNSFREADLRTAELMAGLLSEAMVTAARMKWKEALASERQSMLEALERIKPQIERLGSESAPIENVAAARPFAPPSPPLITPQARAARSPEVCSVCGSDFFDESESFCGICGTARPVSPALSDGPGVHSANQNATPWLTPYGQENPSNGNSGTGAAQTRDTVLKDKAVPATPPASVVSEPRVTPAPGGPERGRTAAGKAIRTGFEASLGDDFRVDQPAASAARSFCAASRSPGPGFAAYCSSRSGPGRSARGVRTGEKCRALSLGFGKKNSEVAGDGKDPPRSPGGMAGAAMAKAAGQFLRGGCGRDAPGCDHWLGHRPAGSTAGNATTPPPSQNRRRLRRS